GGIFWAGYYVGQQPPEKVKNSLRTMSENVVEQALRFKTSQVVIKELITKLQDIKQSLASGKNVSQEKIEEVQKELDGLISKE
ncbi:MAG: hypothetical protein VX564_03015, partial [Nitrospirota bacterium]|nr:hypothetical protein [Nitrospirota bacterium]